MATKLQETRSLVALTQRLGQAPAPELLEQLERLETAETKRLQREAEIRSRIAQDLAEIFTPEPVPTPPPPIVPNLLTAQLQEAVQIAKPAETTSVADQIAASIRRQVQTEGTVVRPDAEMPPATAALEQKVKYLENWISRIAATGPGGGEVNLRYLDDVARETIVDGHFLRYDAGRKKFIFDGVASGEVIYGTTSITNISSYTVQASDYYIGVNNNTSTTINLTSAASGRTIIIKDESGAAATNPITVAGTVDNDAGGFIIQINNGAVQLIYRNGWRII